MTELERIARKEVSLFNDSPHACLYLCARVCFPDRTTAKQNVSARLYVCVRDRHNMNVIEEMEVREEKCLFKLGRLVSLHTVCGVAVNDCQCSTLFIGTIGVHEHPFARQFQSSWSNTKFIASN